MEKRRKIGGRLTIAMGGKMVNQCRGSANFLISARGTPIDSMIWNWYANPVDFAITLPFFPLDLSTTGGSTGVASSASFSSAA